MRWVSMIYERKGFYTVLALYFLSTYTNPKPTITQNFVILDFQKQIILYDS